MGFTSEIEKGQIKNQSIVFFFLLLFTFFVLEVATGDGWTHHLFQRGDDAWFYTAGKAWMEGLTPYVDFADSKGPLLWLIYGLSYKISPYNFHGTFLFELLFYFLTFVTLYKASRLYLCNDYQSLIATMAMSLIFFYPGMHREIRSEDFCHLFNSISFYVILATFYSNKYKNRYAYFLGLAGAGALLIKYSSYIVLGVPALFIFVYVCVKKKKLVWTSLLCYFGGLLTIALPFIIYLFYVGAFDNFIHEYFLNTLDTILKNRTDINVTHESISAKWPFNLWPTFRKVNYRAEYMRFILLGVIFGAYSFRKHRLFNLAMLIWYICCLLLFSVVDDERYYIALGIFLFTGLIGAVKIIKIYTLPQTLLVGGIIIAFLALISIHYIYGELHFPLEDKRAGKQLLKVAEVFNNKEKELQRPPTITFLNTEENGELVYTNVLPGIKYWSTQSGITDEMREEQEKDLFEKRPDFVIIRRMDKESAKKLESHDYSFYLQYNPTLHQDTTNIDTSYLIYWLYINNDIK